MCRPPPYQQQGYAALLRLHRQVNSCCSLAAQQSLPCCRAHPLSSAPAADVSWPSLPPVHTFAFNRSAASCLPALCLQSCNIVSCTAAEKHVPLMPSCSAVVPSAHSSTLCCRPCSTTSPRCHPIFGDKCLLGTTCGQRAATLGSGGLGAVYANWWVGALNIHATPSDNDFSERALLPLKALGLFPALQLHLLIWSGWNESWLDSALKAIVAQIPSYRLWALEVYAWFGLSREHEHLLERCQVQGRLRLSYHQAASAVRLQHLPCAVDFDLLCGLQVWQHPRSCQPAIRRRLVHTARL